MQQYELMVIFSPVLSEDDYKAGIKQYEDLVKKEHGTVVASEPWGLKNLAYPIEKKSVGIYWLLTYAIKPENTTNFGTILQTELYRDERILRHMVTRLDKTAAVYNEKRREKKNTPQKNDDESAEVVSELEGAALVQKDNTEESANSTIQNTEAVQKSMKSEVEEGIKNPPTEKK